MIGEDEFLSDRFSIGRKEQLQFRIENVLRHKEEVLSDSYSKSLEELIEDLKIYQYELEFQNEELQRIQAQLELSRDEFQALFRHAPMGYVVLDADLVILDCNNKFRKMIRREEPCNEGVDFRRFIHPSAQDKFHIFWQKLLKDKNTLPIEIAFYPESDRTVIVQIHGIYRTEADKPRLLLAILDITQQYHDRILLETSEAKFNTLVNRMVQGLALHKIELDRQGNPVDYTYLDVNKAFELATGLSREQVIGKKVSEVLPGIDHTLVEKYGRVALTGESTQFESFFPPLKKHYHVVAYQTEYLHFATVFSDISSRVEAEALILHKNIELQRLNTQKDKFYSIIAHDLRSPFNSFLGFTQILSEELRNFTFEETQEIANRLRISAISMYRLIENLLHWSMLQQGSTKTNPQVLDLLSMISEAADLVMDSASKKEIRFNVEVAGDLRVFADEKSVQTILRNLLYNAIKFTRKTGEITVGAELILPGEVHITVKDSGIGMDSELLNNLFGDSGKTSRPGTEGEASAGLGLILCKELVESQHGKIWAESQSGVGSTFHFTLPLAL